MNTADDRLTLPPPACCLSCARLDKWERLVTVRFRCKDERPMHDNCGYHQPKPLLTEPE